VLTGELAPWMDDLRGRVTTGVWVEGVVVVVEGTTVRAERRVERLDGLPRLRTEAAREVFGSELKESSCEWDAADAGRIEDQLGLPKTPWMVWMRWAGTTRAMRLRDGKVVMNVEYDGEDEGGLDDKGKGKRAT
jgi:hypothetical protein